MSPLEAAKERLTISDVGARLFPDWKPGKSCRCPWREDRSPSFSVSDDGRLWNDFAAGDGGDVVSFIAKAQTCSDADASRELIRWAGVHDADFKPIPPRPVAVPVPRVKPNLPELDEGTRAERAALARLRNLSADAIGLAVDRGLLRFASFKDGRAWVITDADRWAAQARRLDGKCWRMLNGQPKAWTLAGSRASWPIGFADAIGRRRVALVEGGPDAAAALHHAIASGCESEVGVACMIGAACRIPEECLPGFGGLAVRIFAHNDENGRGQEAARKWAVVLHNVGARVSVFDFAGMVRMDGNPVNDLCDLASIDVDSWEMHRDAIESAMDF